MTESDAGAIDDFFLDLPLLNGISPEDQTIIKQAIIADRAAAERRGREQGLWEAAASVEAMCNYPRDFQCHRHWKTIEMLERVAASAGGE